MPQEEAPYTYTNGIPAFRVGELLRMTRISAGIAERDAARSLGVRARRLRRWEEGDEVPSDCELDDFMVLCGCSLDDLFPQRDRIEFDPRSLLMRVGDQVVSIMDPDNEVVLTTYLRLVRQQRVLSPEESVHLRRTDVDLLSGVLDLHDHALEERLVEKLGMSSQAAADLRQKMIRRRHPSAQPRPMS
jgi:transcriptional regulator with XRE-family HTH domain